MDKICEYCGNPFSPKRISANYCSNSHRVMAHRSKKAVLKGGTSQGYGAKKLLDYMATKGANQVGLWELAKSLMPVDLKIPEKAIVATALPHIDVNEEEEVVKDFNYYNGLIKGIDDDYSAEKFVKEVEKSKILSTSQKDKLKQNLKAKWL